MRAEDLTVEVRDVNLKRKGIILTRDLSLSAKIRWSSVGEWKLTLPGDHPMVPYLRTPGSGLIVTGPTGPSTLGTVFSGPTIQPKRLRNLKNPDGTLTFSGVTDEIHLQDSLAYPSPSVANPAAQTATNDVRTGKTETLMRQYVDANIGPSAPSGRRRGLLSKIVLGGADATLGKTTSKSPRYQNLLELLQELATEATLGFRLMQEGDQLVFRVVPVRDLRKKVRLDVDQGTLTSEEVAFQGSGLTKAIVAGQGEGTARTIVTRTTAQSVADETAWGRAIEVFYDRRDSDDLLELQAKGDEELAATAGGTSAKVVPSDDATMRYLIDWREGDWLTVVVEGVEQTSVATEAVLLMDSKRAVVGAALGDVSTFDPRDTQAKKQNSIDSRLSYLERASAREASSAMGQQVSNWNDATDAGWYWGNGATNAPVAGNLSGTVTRNGASVVVQEVNDPADASRVYRRTYAGSWGPWVRTSAPGSDGQPFRMAAGRVQSSTGGGSVAPIFWDNSVTVTLPVGRFTANPIIAATPYMNGSSSVGAGASLDFAGTASFVVRVNRVNAAPNGALYTDWIAVQMTSGSGAG